MPSTFDRLVEEKIRAAQAAGQFDQLNGTGQPLNLSDSPFEDAAERDLNRMVKEQGFRPEWLELDVELREQMERAVKTLRRTYEWYQAELKAIPTRFTADLARDQRLAEAEWERAQAQFRAAVESVNRSIFLLNLKVPIDSLQRRKVDAEAELRRVVG